MKMSQIIELYNNKLDAAKAAGYNGTEKNRKGFRNKAEGIEKLEQLHLNVTAWLDATEPKQTEEHVFTDVKEAKAAIAEQFYLREDKLVAAEPENAQQIRLFTHRLLDQMHYRFADRNKTFGWAWADLSIEVEIINAQINVYIIRKGA